MLRSTVIALSVVVFGCAGVVHPEEPNSEQLRFQDIASGTWGFPVGGASCEDNPHTIEFTEDAERMILRYAKGLEGNPPTEAKYRILGEGPGFMRMEIEGETRTTDEGIPVKWDMVLLSPDSYCWHRTDWQEGGCTQPAERCSGDRSPD